MRVFLSYAHQHAGFARRVGSALIQSGLEVSDPDRDNLPGDNWAGEIARALEDSEAMVVLLTPAAAGSPDVKRNIEYALGAKNYSNRLIPVVRRMPWFELEDSEAECPEVGPIANAVLSHA